LLRGPRLRLISCAGVETDAIFSVPNPNLNPNLPNESLC
jgi:hypothetical protein